jgi:type II secretory pathway pseudopilin PulG
MKPRFSNQTNRAMTLVEAVVVIAVLAVFVAMLLPAIQHNHRYPASRINCVNSLKEIGLAYRVWAGDNNDKFPMEISVTNGGTMELAATGNVVATFQIMSSELSTPKLLYCTSDKDRTCATNFTTDFSAKHISYFVGLDTANTNQQIFLSGDDNPACWGFRQMQIRLGLWRGIILTKNIFGRRFMEWATLASLRVRSNRTPVLNYNGHFNKPASPPTASPFRETVLHRPGRQRRDARDDVGAARHRRHAGIR